MSSKGSVEKHGKQIDNSRQLQVLSGIIFALPLLQFFLLFSKPLREIGGLILPLHDPCIRNRLDKILSKKWGKISCALWVLS